MGAPYLSPLSLEFLLIAYRSSLVGGYLLGRLRKYFIVSVLACLSMLVFMTVLAGVFPPILTLIGYFVGYLQKRGGSKRKVVK